MARIALTDENGALFGAPAIWLSSVYTPSADLRSALTSMGFRSEPDSAWVHWGDSMTQGSGWVGEFAANNGHDGYNGGIGGETAEQIHARMLGAEGEPYRDRKFTIGVGRNGFKTTEPLEIAALIREMLNHFTTEHKGFVFDVPPWASETEPATAGSTREKLNILNATLEEWFPTHFFPVFSLLRREEAAHVAGIVFTDQDRIDIANDVTPISLRGENDPGHLNATGGKVVAYYLHQEAFRRGYVKTRPILPAVTIMMNYAVVPDPSVGLGWTGSGNGTIPYTNAYGVHTYETVTGMDLPTAARFKGLAGVSSYPEITAGKDAATRASIPAGGGQFTASLQIRASKAVEMQVRIKPYGVTAGDTWGPKVMLQAGVPQRLSVTATLPDGVTHIAVAAIATANSMMDESHFDVTALMVTSGPTVYPYRDGNSAGWTWTGTAKQSTSSGPPSA